MPRRRRSYGSVTSLKSLRLFRCSNDFLFLWNQDGNSRHNESLLFNPVQHTTCVLALTVACVSIYQARASYTYHPVCSSFNSPELLGEQYETWRTSFRNFIFRPLIQHSVTHFLLVVGSEGQKSQTKLYL
jgi:hypothetical protein